MAAAGWSTERLLRLLTAGAAITIVALLLAIALRLAVGGAPAFERFGAGFLVGTTWDVVNGIYGALPFVVGTVFQCPDPFPTMSIYDKVRPDSG